MARVIDPTMVTTVEANVAVELTGTTRGAPASSTCTGCLRQPNARVAIARCRALLGLVVAAVAALG